MKAIGFLGGHAGDLMMCLVAAKAHKEKYPNSKLTFSASKKHSGILPLTLSSKFVDSIHTWDGYDDWPNTEDKLYLTSNIYDIIYPPNQKHTNEFWYLQKHQTAEACERYGLHIPNSLKIDLSKTWDNKKENYIAIAPFGVTRGQDKNMTAEQANKIVNLILKLGFIPVQLGTKEEFSICENRFFGNFIDSVIFMTSCRALVTVDTAMSWIASAYNVPTVGLYGYEYYAMAKSSKNWQPINPNAIYLESNRASNIIIERVEEALKQII